ncbi:MAG: nucleoside triphosphate pyrophosphohydrolase [Vicinamibacterales bacterium]
MSESAEREFKRLVEVVAELRGPEGCPWDRKQTYRSLRPFVLEEAYEVLEAIDRDDVESLGEEIGDLVFEGVLLAQLAAEAGDFTISDSLRSITDKLIRRHPHVFGTSSKAGSAEEVLGLWEAAKARERAGEAGEKTILGGVPASLPALLAAHEMSTRAAAVGFDWERATDVLAKIQEEVDELRTEVEAVAAGSGNLRAVEEEMGDLLFAIANLSRKLGVEPEAALRQANAKFRRRFTEMERRIVSRGGRLQDMALEALEAEWEHAKEGLSNED